MQHDMVYCKEIQAHFINKSQGVMMAMMEIFRVNYIRVTKVLLGVEEILAEMQKRFKRVSLLSGPLVSQLEKLAEKISRVTRVTTGGFGNLLDEILDRDSVENGADPSTVKIVDELTQLGETLESFMTGENFEFDLELAGKLSALETRLKKIETLSMSVENRVLDSTQEVFTGFSQNLTLFNLRTSITNALSQLTFETLHPAPPAPKIPTLDLKIQRIFRELLSIESKYDSDLLLSDCFILPQLSFLKSLDSLLSNLKQFLRTHPTSPHFHLTPLSLPTKSITYILKIISTHSIDYLYSLNKLQYLLSSVLYNIVFKGFCKAPTEDDAEDGNDDAQDGKMEITEGMGIGEGKGQENVSKEIEFEEQA
jgi:hypothetical protein